MYIACDKFLKNVTSATQLTKNETLYLCIIVKDVKNLEILEQGRLWEETGKYGNFVWGKKTNPRNPLVTKYCLHKIKF